MLAFIKGYLILSLISNVAFILIIKYDCEHYDSDDPRGWN